MSNLADFFKSQIAQGAKSGADAANEMFGTQDRAAAAQTQARLQTLLGIQSHGAEQSQDIAAIQKMKDQGLVPDGGLAKAGGVETGMSPTMKTMQAEASARQHATQFYNQQSKGLNDSVDAVQNGLKALQDNDQTSVGRIRAAMLKANGFNRYNEAEGAKSLPDSEKDAALSTLQKYGFDFGKGNLSDSQRAASARFFNDKTSEINDRHTAIKGQAQDTYSSATFATPEGQSALSKMGSGIDGRIQNIGKQLQDFQKKAVPEQPSQGTDKPSPGLLQQAGGALSNWLNPPRASQAAPQQPSTSAVGDTQQAAPIDPLDAELAKRAGK